VVETFAPAPALTTMMFGSRPISKPLTLFRRSVTALSAEDERRLVHARKDDHCLRLLAERPGTRRLGVQRVQRRSRLLVDVFGRCRLRSPRSDEDRGRKEGKEDR